MSIRRAPRGGRSPAVEALPHAAELRGALTARDFERAALCLLIDLASAARQGTIDDLIACLGGDELDGDAARR